MSNPSGPDDTEAAARTEANTSGAGGDPPAAERRFTAPSSFDAGETAIIGAVEHEPATEVMPVSEAPAGATPVRPNTQAFPEQTNAAPQAIPPRTATGKPRRRRSSWGWVIALILVILALVAVAVLGTVVLTHDDAPKVSQEDLVRTTIENFDTSIQKGDLATLRSITCGATAESYIKYDDAQWKDIHSRIAAARQYPVVASVDQIVVHDNHAEANVTTFMAFDPATRSTRSLDLEFRDEKWKICQAPA
jgi:nitrate reductase NapE component